jgi:hypothetical protein
MIPADIDALDPYTDQPWNPKVAAAEGAALLDRLPWLGWRELVAPERLDMGDGQYQGERWYCKGCVGAQLAYQRHPPVSGIYSEFVAVVWPWLYTDDATIKQSLDFTVHYGFRAPLEDGSPRSFDYYQQLTDAWLEILTP